MSVIIVCDGKKCAKEDSTIFYVSESAKKVIRESDDVCVQHLCKSCFSEINEKIQELSVAGWMIIHKIPIIRRERLFANAHANNTVKQQVRYKAQYSMEK